MLPASVSVQAPAAARPHGIIPGCSRLLGALGAAKSLPSLFPGHLDPSSQHFHFCVAFPKLLEFRGFAATFPAEVLGSVHFSWPVIFPFLLFSYSVNPAVTKCFGLAFYYHILQHYIIILGL